MFLPSIQTTRVPIVFSKLREKKKQCRNSILPILEGRTFKEDRSFDRCSDVFRKTVRYRSLPCGSEERYQHSFQRGFRVRGNETFVEHASFSALRELIIYNSLRTARSFAHAERFDRGKPQQESFVHGPAHDGWFCRSDTLRYRRHVLDRQDLFTRDSWGGGVLGHLLAHLRSERDHRYWVSIHDFSSVRSQRL